MAGGSRGVGQAGDNSRRLTDLHGHGSARGRAGRLIKKTAMTLHAEHKRLEKARVHVRCAHIKQVSRKHVNRISSHAQRRARQDRFGGDGRSVIREMPF